MSHIATTSPGKGKMRCNACTKTTATKDGDWFVTTGSSSQQVFLCKLCEHAKRGVYKRANLMRV